MSMSRMMNSVRFVTSAIGEKGSLQYTGVLRSAVLHGVGVDKVHGDTNTVGRV